jgi:hypothetical protein
MLGILRISIKQNIVILVAIAVFQKRTKNNLKKINPKINYNIYK